jgi:hypothetical protein
LEETSSDKVVLQKVELKEEEGEGNIIKDDENHKMVDALGS